MKVFPVQAPPDDRTEFVSPTVRETDKVSLPQWRQLLGAVGGLLAGVPSLAHEVGAVTVVLHGSNAATARPVGALSVTWIGTVTPANMTDADLYIAPA